MSVLRPTARIVLAALFVLGLAQAPARAADDFSPAQKKAIEQIVRDLLRDNPEILIEAVHAARAKQEAAAAAKAKQALDEHRQELERSPTSPVIGNPDGDVTVVEFFDYRCPYCKRVHPVVVELIKTDPKVRVVLKELPILGPESVLATRAALAVHLTQPAKYRAFLDALLDDKGRVTREHLAEVARGAGIDVQAMEKAMNDPRIERTIAENMGLAEALGINGTPAFVVGRDLAPGAVDLETLRGLVAKARKG